MEPIKDIDPGHENQTKPPASQQAVQPAANPAASEEINPQDWFRSDNRTPNQNPSKTKKAKLILIMPAAAILLLAGSGAYFALDNKTASDTGNPSDDQSLVEHNWAEQQSVQQTEPSQQKDEESKNDDNEAPATTPEKTSSTNGSSPDSTVAKPQYKTYVINYTNSCYDKTALSINNGDTIKFVNQSSRDMWPASNKHPQHTDYSEFDSDGNIPPSGSYSFRFTKKGKWGFHDHLKPNCSGTVTVS